MGACSVPFHRERVPNTVSVSDEISSNWLTLNSCSRKLRRLSSQESSNAVNIGSLDDNEIKLGLANALYAFIRDRECLNESSSREITHSSQPHLSGEKREKDEWYWQNCGLWRRHYYPAWDLYWDRQCFWNGLGPDQFHNAFMCPNSK